MYQLVNKIPFITPPGMQLHTQADPHTLIMTCNVNIHTAWIQFHTYPSPTKGICNDIVCAFGYPKPYKVSGAMLELSWK